MELTAAEQDLFGEYLATFDRLAGDRRTRALLRATVRGIMGAESRCGRRIAACPPGVGGDRARPAARAAPGPR